jgi:hypothetical protein
MHPIGICLMGVYLMGAYLMGVHFNGRASHGHASHRHIPYRHASQGHIVHTYTSHKCAPRERVSHGYVSCVCLIGIRLKVIYFMGMHLIGAGLPRHPPRARGHPNSHPNSLAPRQTGCLHGRIGAAAESKRGDVDIHLLTSAFFWPKILHSISIVVSLDALLTQCKSTLHDTQSSLMNNAVKPGLVSNMADPFMYINGRVVIGKGSWDPCLLMK